MCQDLPSSDIEVPPGFRFQPTNEELINYYLKPKIEGNHSVVDNYIVTIDDLLKLDPSELHLLCSKPWDAGIYCYFFYKWKRNGKGNRVVRKTETGSWKKTGKCLDIHMDSNKNIVIGKRSIFVFHRDFSSSSPMTEYTMHVFEMINHSSNQGEPYTLCRLNKNTIETKKKKVNCETRMDPGLYSELPIGSQLTEQQSPFVAADSSDASAEDFVNGLFLDDIADPTIPFNDPDCHMPLKRSYFGDAPDESDTDAEGANAPYFQTGESSGYFFPNNVSSKKVRQMRMSKAQSKTLKTSVTNQHFVEEQTVIPGSDSLSRNESSSHSLAYKPVEQGISSGPVQQGLEPAVVTGGNRQKRIQILKSDSLSSSSSSTSPVTKSAIKAKEPATYVLQSGTCVKENRDNRKVVEKGRVETRLRSAINESPTSNWSSVITFVDTSSLSIHRCSLSLMEYWLNMIVGSVLFLVFVRELVVFGSW